MAALVLRNIEKSGLLMTTETSVTINLAQPLLSTSKTVLLFSAMSGSATPADYHIIGRVLSTTQISFERVGSAIEVEIAYQVVEFTQGITVQHLYFTQSAATTNTTITAVNLSKAFPILNYVQTGGTWGSNDILTADLSSTTNLQTITGSFTSSAVGVQVVEIDDASVQRIAGSYGTDATADLTVTTIDPAKTFWFFSLSTSSGHSFDNLPYLGYVNTTTLRFTRYLSTGGVSFSYIAFVVSVSARVSVQNNLCTIASSASSVEATISTVIEANTVQLVNGMFQRFAASATANDDAGYNMFTVGDGSATNFYANRTDAPASEAKSNVQSIEFAKNKIKFILIEEFL